MFFKRPQNTQHSMNETKSDLAKNDLKLFVKITSEQRVCHVFHGRSRDERCVASFTIVISFVVFRSRRRHLCLSSVIIY